MPPGSTGFVVWVGTETEKVVRVSVGVAVAVATVPELHDDEVYSVAVTVKVPLALPAVTEAAVKLGVLLPVRWTQPLVPSPVSLKVAPVGRPDADSFT